jgi:GNAT superfamily N-acetyltransferase
MITIRRALEEDAERISRCLAAAFEPFRSEYTDGAYADTVPAADAIRDRMAHMAVFAAVTADGEIVGTVACAVEGDEGHLRGMAVHPAWQGHGIAEQLLGLVVRELRGAGCLQITLDTTEPLRRAASFYRRSGFTPSGKVTDFFGMPLYEYAKPLAGCSNARDRMS